MSEERQEGPTSIDVSDKQIAIGDIPAAVLQEEKSQEQEQKIEPELKQASNVGKKTQRRRVTTYLSHISKQIEKNGHEINKITMVTQSLQKQINLAGIKHSQSIKQVRSQLGQLKKQVARIQKDIQRVKTVRVSYNKSKNEKISYKYQQA
jgi:predicted  nucleic acid-binding Zn-ribbon protein